MQEDRLTFLDLLGVLEEGVGGGAGGGVVGEGGQHALVDL